jgi:hypothetical protein
MDSGRLRCARRLHLSTVPFVSLAPEEAAGIVCRLRAANDHALSLLEQARSLDEFKASLGMTVSEIAQQLSRSQTWGEPAPLAIPVRPDIPWLFPNRLFSYPWSRTFIALLS